MMAFCSHCGGNLAFDGAKFCAHCGKPQSSTPGPVAVAPSRGPDPPKEHTLLDEEMVTVTTTRFIVPGQTYPIAGITSIANTVDSSMAPAGLVIVGIGIAAIGGSLGSTPGAGAVIVVGAVLLLAGVVGMTVSKSKHHVVLTTSAGEVRAFTSTDKDLINNVVVALNQAIVRRG